jgi:SEC-C motif-containing protein
VAETSGEKPAILPAAPCPCGGGRTFGECCQPILAGKRAAESAEQLMRSRFTAHVAHDDLYLHRSQLSTSKEPFEPEGEPQRREWTRLVIHAHEVGAGGDSAIVDFTAYFKEGETEQTHPERSVFQRVDGAWYFVRPLRQGPAPVRSTQAKVGRNDPCPCGSGRKYKQCCLRTA